MDRGQWLLLLLLLLLLLVPSLHISTSLPPAAAMCRVKLNPFAALITILAQLTGTGGHSVSAMEHAPVTRRREGMARQPPLASASAM